MKGEVEFLHPRRNVILTERANGLPRKLRVLGGGAHYIGSKAYAVSFERVRGNFRTEVLTLSLKRNHKGDFLAGPILIPQVRARKASEAGQRIFVCHSIVGRGGAQLSSWGRKEGRLSLSQGVGCVGIPLSLGERIGGYSIRRGGRCIKGYAILPDASKTRGMQNGGGQQVFVGCDEKARLSGEEVYAEGRKERSRR